MVVSPRILVANVTMLFNSESRVDRNVIYFEVNKLKNLYTLPDLVLSYPGPYIAKIHRQIG